METNYCEWLVDEFDPNELRCGRLSRFFTSDKPLTAKELLKIGRIINSTIYRMYKYSEGSLGVFDLGDNGFVNCVAVSHILHILWEELFHIETKGAITKGHMFSVIELSDNRLIALDGDPKVITGNGKQSIQYPLSYPWLLVGCQKTFYIGATLLHLGSECRQQKKYKDAEEYYISALNIFPHNPDLYRNYGNLLCECSRYNEGVEMYRTSLNLFPDDETTNRAMQIALSRL